MLYEWIKSMDFANPMAFGLLLAVPVLLWWYVNRYNKQQATVTVSSAYPFTVKSWKNRFRHLPFILRLLALICLVLALARPQKRNDEQQTLGEGIDIVLCIDVSGSMTNTDIPPNRLEAAKEVAINFVMGRPVDRIGLVIFSGESFTQCPITADKNTLVDQIRSLSVGLLQSGTVIGEGLATAVDRISQSSAKSKVIILITDGKEEAPATRLIDPLTAMEIAKTKGIKVYTIGMGARASGSSEIAGTPATPGRKDPSADFIDVALLQRIAEETGGKYFRARDKDALENTYNEIDKMEKSEVEMQAFKRFEERYLPFVLAALGFLFLEILLRFTVFRKFP